MQIKKYKYLFHFLSFLLNRISNASPLKTSKTPIHCRHSNGLLNKITEANIVKNLRVVVTNDNVRGPNDMMVMKMKF